MQTPRPKLSPRAETKLDEDAIAALLADAIGRRQCLRWTYNRTRMLVAPRILYRWNDSLHCDAVVIERDGIRLTEARLGTFRLTGLGQIARTDQVPDANIKIPSSDSRYAGGVIAGGSC